jgi:hypothetical protein
LLGFVRPLKHSDVGGDPEAAGLHALNLRVSPNVERLQGTPDKRAKRLCAGAVREAERSRKTQPPSPPLPSRLTRTPRPSSTSAKPPWGTQSLTFRHSHGARRRGRIRLSCGRAWQRLSRITGLLQASANRTGLHNDGNSCEAVSGVGDYGRVRSPSSAKLPLGERVRARPLHTGR